MLTVTITELNVRGVEHVRIANDANRYGWMRVEARGGLGSKLRGGFSAFAGSVGGLPADRCVRINTAGSMPAQETAPRGAS